MVKQVLLVVGSLVLLLTLVNCEGGCGEGMQEARRSRVRDGNSYDEKVCVPKYELPQTPRLTPPPPGAPTVPGPAASLPTAGHDLSFIDGKWKTKVTRAKYDFFNGIGSPRGTLVVDYTTALEFFPDKMEVTRSCELIPGLSTVEAVGASRTSVKVTLALQMVEVDKGSGKIPVIRILNDAEERAKLTYTTKAGKVRTENCDLKFKSGDMQFLTYDKPEKKLVLPYVPSGTESPWIESASGAGTEYHFFR